MAVAIFRNHVEIGAAAYEIFEALKWDVDPLAGGVTILNTVHKKGQLDDLGNEGELWFFAILSGISQMLYAES